MVLRTQEANQAAITHGFSLAAATADGRGAAKVAALMEEEVKEHHRRLTGQGSALQHYHHQHGGARQAT